MGKSDLAPGHKRFEFRAGFNDFQWRGMLTNGDAGANPPNRPRMLVNGRLDNGAIVERAGLTAFDSTALHSSSACVRLIADFPLAGSGGDGGRKLWIRGDGCPGISAGSGFYIAHIDQEQSPEYQRALHYLTTTNALIMGSFDGNLHLGVDSELRRLQLIPVPYGTENITVSGTAQDTPIHTFTGFTVRCLQEFDSKLFIGLDAGAGVSKLATWDGLGIRDDLTGINVPTCFGSYRVQNGGDAIVVGFGAATNHIRYRPTGASPGTWVTVTPSAGTVASFSMASYKDVLYIADGLTGIWAYDGITLSLVRTPASATVVRAVTVFNNFLYFGYDTASAARVGKYDGSTWTDVEKTIPGADQLKALAGYRGSLIAATTFVGAGGIAISPGLATTGTWVQFNLGATNNGDVDTLLVA